MGHGSDYAADCRHRLTAGWRQCRGDRHGLPQTAAAETHQSDHHRYRGRHPGARSAAAIALYLLSLPWLKIVGALLLLWIGIKLVRNEEEESEVSSSGSLWRTAITITVADVIMSLDNVLAVAAAGKGHIALVALGVAISIPVIVAGSKLVLVLLTRFPAVVLLGGMLIGWIAGSMLVSDPTIRQLFPSAGEGTARLAGAVGALLVLFTGWRCRPRPQAKD